MRYRRIAGAAAALAVAVTALVLTGNTVGAAAPVPPTPITLDLTGLGSASCGPLPLNSAVYVKPSTTLNFKAGTTLLLSPTVTLTISPEPGKTDPKSSKSYTVKAAGNLLGQGKVDGVNIALPGAIDYTLKWTNAPVLGLLLATTETGHLITNASAQKCVVAVQVPVPSVSVPLPVLSPVTNPINGVLSTVANGANGVLSPINGLVGPILGGVNGTVGGVVGGLPGGSKPIAGVPPTGPGTNYQPTGPTVAQRTVPQGYGNGSGLGGTSVTGSGGALNAPAIGFLGTGKPGTGSSSAAIKSGGSPKTVELSADKPGSALNGWSTVIVLAAIIALSGATAFYARTFLLHPPPRTIKA